MVRPSVTTSTAGSATGSTVVSPVNPPASVARGAARRVADVHRQTRRGLLVSAGFVVAAVVTGVAGIGVGWWIPLHLFVVGAMLSAISTVTQMFAVTWSASPAPAPAVAGVQRWALAAGTIALVVGRGSELRWLFVTGGVTVIVSMLAVAAVLVWIVRHAVTDRFSPAIEAYVAAIVAGAVGMSLGVVLGSDLAGVRARELREVHLVLNLFGLVGLVIAGSLPYFVATQVRSKMSKVATAAELRLTNLALASATALAAWGSYAGRPGFVAVGLIAYAIVLAAIVVTLPIRRMRSIRWAGPRIVQLVAGVAWWAAMAVALAIARLHADDDRQILQALAIGGFVQIFVASLAYLGPVLRGGGHERLTAGFATTRSWVSLGLGNVAAVAALTGHHRVLAVLLVAWTIDVGIRGARLLSRSKGERRV